LILGRSPQLVDALVAGALVEVGLAVDVPVFAVEDAGAGAGPIMETCDPSPNVIVLVLDPSALIVEVIVGPADDAVEPVELVDWAFDGVLVDPFVLVVPPTEFSKSD
jgi:hypothetical protein